MRARARAAAQDTDVASRIRLGCVLGLQLDRKHERMLLDMGLGRELFCSWHARGVLRPSGGDPRRDAPA